MKTKGKEKMLCKNVNALITKKKKIRRRRGNAVQKKSEPSLKKKSEENFESGDGDEKEVVHLFFIVDMDRLGCFRFKKCQFVT